MAIIIIWPAARWRIKVVMAFMIPMGIGLWLVHSHWLQSLFSHSDKISFTVPIFAIALWLRLLVFFAAAQLWLQTVSTQRFVAALLSSRLPVGIAYLCAGPLLLKEQLKQQLAAIKEAQSARGVSFDGTLIQRLKTIVPLLSPLLLQSLNDLTTRSAGLDARAFRLYPHRTVLKPIFEHRWEPFLRAVLLCCLLVEGGAFWLYHSISIG
ncbi:energy-coupling factor transporter transmembrane component T [Hafnia alvei]|uniref:energy-coupling factor transporter transmembrane component T n=1 Tax=Hafnia alvei TaxID=569 RepID=UPI0020C7BB36|nr:energy-coupling factor transporter transmembrane component T [Hafnia alvei]